MADADEEEPAPPADLDIAAPAADTAMDEEAEPAAPMGVPMATTESEAVAMDADAQPGSGLDEQLVQAAQAAGIDLAFLEALPEELRSEVCLCDAALALTVRYQIVCLTATSGSKPICCTCPNLAVDILSHCTPVSHCLMHTSSHLMSDRCCNAHWATSM